MDSRPAEAARDPEPAPPEPGHAAPAVDTGRREGSTAWAAWEQAALRLVSRFDGLARQGRFHYQQPTALQAATPRRLRRPYAVPVHYTDWGPRAAPVLLCCGGVANTAARFSFLAADLQRAGLRVVCMDWLGRGRSGWLADDHEYNAATYLEQLRQCIAHLGIGPVSLLGSSMGGSVALALAAKYPTLVQRLVLNDVGPHMARARRLRRSQTLARWYVFQTPADIMRRVGAAQKNDGPVADDVRHFLAWHMTRWSEADAGRVYRHDPRALLAYRQAALQPLQQWEAWHQVRCPLLVLHGMESDALSSTTLARMQRTRPITVAHVPRTGHTPVLNDRHQTALVADWLCGAWPAGGELSVPLAPARRPART